uniref:Si:dkeyp-101e12.1 n=1 Tax=Nothobranchius korthausae TaxID=1143690 RepID=A0A1A8H235_9TELE
MRLTTLTSKFLGELDRQTDNLIKVFNSKGGDAGRKMAAIMAQMDNNEDINEVNPLGREDKVGWVLAPIRPHDARDDISHLNNKNLTLSRESTHKHDIDSREAEADITDKTMGIYTVRAEGHGPVGPGDGRFADVGVVLEGMEVLHNLQCQPCMCDALWTDLCTQLELFKKPEAYFRGVPENLDGPGLNQTVTKSACTETQIAPVIWLTVMH